MNRFLKSFCLLLCGGLFTATGWAETIASNREQLWAAWNPIQLGAPTTSNTQNDISAQGWSMNQSNASYMAHTLTPIVGSTAPYIDFGAEVGFGYEQNPSTIVATIKLPAEMTSETPKKLFTLAGYQNTTRFHLGLKSISATDGATFDVGYNNGNWSSNLVTVPDLKPGQKVTLALFYSKTGIVLSQINYRGATQLAKWNGMQASRNSCTRVTFGADHNTSAEIAFSIYGIEIYRNVSNEIALTFPVNLKQQINQEIIGINFSRNNLKMSTTSTALCGYQQGEQGGFLAEHAWQGFYVANKGNPLVVGQAYAIETAGNPALNITLTKNSDNLVYGPDNHTNNLLGSYLDNDSNLTFNGLPKTGYDVAIIFAGDGGNFSRVRVNGVNKTYDADGNLVDGDSKWGDRTTSANDLKRLEATGTATTGQVMYLADLSAETLTLQTYNESNTGGRGTIAAIQIYIHEASYSPVLEDASSYWTFENAFADLKGTIDWTGNNGWNNNDTDAYVESLRVNEEGEYNKAVKISDAFHPGPRSAYTFSNEFTAAAFVNVANCPDKGVIASFGDVCWLRKLNATEAEPIRLCFGDATNNVTATIDNLTFGYHLVVVTKSTTGISIQIDNEAPVTSAENATLPTINLGFQLGVDWTGLSDDADQATNLLIDEFGIWNRVLKADEIAQLAGLIPAAYPLSKSADKDSDDVISKTELDAVVGKATKWKVFGDVALQIEEDLGLTSLELVAMNSSTGDSLTITGAGSLYGDNFALTTAIPVDITNQKNNPSITFSGAGNVTIRKGNGPTAGGIAPAMSNYTGVLTVDDGQQITRMGGDLTIPFTVGANGAKLHSNDGDWTVSSKISGSGTLTIASPSRWIAVTHNANDFTGNVVVESGTLYVGNKGSVNSGSDAQLGNGNSTYTVKSGATFYTHLGDNNKTFAPNITLEEGAIFGNRDGHVTYSGNIAINGAASYNFYWNKQNTFSGVVSGSGTLTINGPDNEDGTCEIRLTNANNTFTGTYKLAGKNGVRKIKLVACATTAVPSYTLTNAYSILAFSGDVTANGLTGTAGSVESDAAGTARTVTLTGNSDVRNLMVSNDITFAIASGETFITSTTKATVAAGAKVKVVLTADQKLNGLTLLNVTVAEGGSVVFLDIDGTTELLSSSSNVYEAAQTATYTVTAEGGSWNKEPAEGDAVEIAFEDVTEPIDLASILESVKSLAKLTIKGADGGTITNAASDLLCPIIAIEAATTLSAKIAAITDTIEVNAALSIVGTEEETTIAGVISGDGQVKIATGLVKFTNTNTYTGGTDIAADATLTMGNANAIGTTGNITGAGTLKFSQFVPANLSNLNVAEGGWTGTFYMMNRLSAGQFPLNDWGNANSTICLENCSGYLTPATGATFVSNFRVEGDGWRSQNGDANGGQFIFTGALSGSGKLEVATATPEAGNFYKFTGDVSGFTGYVNVTNNHCIVFGNADSQGNGKITIAKDVIIAAQKTWSAVNGIAIMEGATLTVNGAITGAIANAGTLIYSVDTTASNAISGEGFIVANGEGVELDLCSATLTDFNGALNATGGATIKLPYAVTEGKTLSADGTSKFIVVLSNDETDQNNLRAVTVTGLGTLEFVDEAGHTLPSSGSTYVPSVYTVTDEGGSWNIAPLQNNKITIDFANTEGKKVDLAAILGEVTTLSKLTVKGTNGGTIANSDSAVTACSTVVVMAGGRTEMPGALLNLATTVTGPTTDGSLLYVTGETTTTSSNFPYTGNRHFKTIKFTDSLSVGGDINGYTVAEGETVEFLHNDGVRYQTSLVVDGGTVRSAYNAQVWLIGAENAVFTLKAGTADFSSVAVNSGSDALLIGYMGSTHTFDIQGGTLDASNTSIVGYQPDSHYRQSGGLVKTKGFRQNGSNFTEMTLTGGIIQLGSGGISNLGMDSATFGGATIHAVENNTVAEALNMMAASTLSAAADKTMTVTSSIMGEATLVITGEGSVDLSRATIANTIALDVKAGATAVVTAEQVSTFAKLTVAETATLKIKVNYTIDEYLTGGRKTYTVGEGTTIEGTVVWEGLTGTDTSVDGTTLNLVFAANPTLTGSAWWWDYEFDGNGNNSGFEGTSLSWDGDRPLKNGAEYTERGGEDTNQMLKLPSRPYRGVSAWPTAATFVMYAKAGTKTDYHSEGGWNGAVDGNDNGILVSFGSSTYGSHNAITLMTGQNPENGDMRLVYTNGTSKENVVDLVENLSVPNATTSYHLYAFVLEVVDEKTHISVYVDGEEVATYKADSIIQLGPGFQIASVHGGPPEGLNRLANEDTATMDFLRVSDTVLSAEAMQSLARAYPYVSPKGVATRVVKSTDWSWIGVTTEDSDKVWSQLTLNQDGSSTTVAQQAPNEGTEIVLTINNDATLGLNLDNHVVTYEKLTIGGNGTLTLTAEGQNAIQISGRTNINTSAVLPWNTKIGAVSVAAEKTLTFDYSAYTFSNIWATTTIPLTGLASGEGKVEVEFPAEKPAQIASWACVKDPSTSTYAIVVTVDLSDLAGTVSGDACAWDNIVWTINNGETEVAPSNDFLLALPTVRLSVAGDTATLNLSAALSLNAVTVSGGTLTIAGEGLTVTTLTLDGGNVVATPETLMASAVTGTAGTERLTMTLGEGEYTRAMALSNCAFTKAGAGTLKLDVAGTDMDMVNVTLADGELKLNGHIGDPDSGDSRIENTTFNYAGGTLTSNGWVRSASQITFNVPESINNAVAFSGLNLKEPTDAGDAKCSVVKTGAGALTLYLKDAPYAGTTTVSEGTMVYAGETCTLSGAITVKAGAAIKGSANCTLTSLILESGAIIDATVAPVTATTVKLPTEEGAKVVLKKNASGDVLTYTGDLPNMNLFTTATTLENKALGLGVKVDNGVVTLVLTQVSVPEVVIPDDATDEERAELVKQQAEANVAAQIVADALAASTDEETRTANVTAIENPGVASVIENADIELIPNDDEGTYTATFTYEFGVSTIKVVALNLDDVEGTELYVVVKAELDDDYSFADGVTVSVTDGENAVEGAVSVNETGTETTDKPTGNTRYFRFPLPTDIGTHSYKVKASN